MGICASCLGRQRNDSIDEVCRPQTLALIIAAHADRINSAG